jgi:hypothetical protein
MRRLVVLAAILGLVTVPLALATSTATDPNDVKGKLDLKKLVAARDRQLMRVTITTYDRWAARILRGPGGPRQGRNRLTVLYDIGVNDRVADYRGRVVYSGGRLRLWISGNGSNYEPLPVTRPSRLSVTWTQPIDIFFHGPPAGPRRVYLAVKSLYRRKGTACAKGCRDRIPNKGWIVVAFHLP